MAAKLELYEKAQEAHVALQVRRSHAALQVELERSYSRESELRSRLSALGDPISGDSISDEPHAAEAPHTLPWGAAAGATAGAAAEAATEVAAEARCGVSCRSSASSRRSRGIERLSLPATREEQEEVREEGEAGSTPLKERPPSARLPSSRRPTGPADGAAAGLAAAAATAAAAGAPSAGAPSAVTSPRAVETTSKSGQTLVRV